jgi:hypothetical protein
MYCLAATTKQEFSKVVEALGKLQAAQDWTKDAESCQKELGIMQAELERISAETKGDQGNLALVDACLCVTLPCTCPHEQNICYFRDLQRLCHRNQSHAMDPDHWSGEVQKLRRRLSL